MKDTLKMQEMDSVTGTKKIIDYYNETYTKKKEYIYKDLKPIKWLTKDEYYDFQEKSGIHMEETFYCPLFKIPKKESFPECIDYVLRVGTKKIKSWMGNSEPNSYSDYNNGVFMTINNELNEIALSSPSYFSSKDLDVSLTLYIGSPELPKLEYPKNKMDMYRAINFIETIYEFTYDESLGTFLGRIRLPLPSNIDEINLLLDSPRFNASFGIRRNAYFINPDKDNYYTILDAIKKGKTMYKGFNTPLVNWSINKEEKIIKIGNIMVTETSVVLPPV